MEQFLEYVKSAFKNIKDNKTRSVLTMLGIIIGISSVIMIMSIGNGVTGFVTDELNAIFSNSVYFMVNADENFEDSMLIEEEDLQEAKETIDNIKALSAEESEYGIAHSIKGDFSAYITFCDDDYQYSKKDGFVGGRYFTHDELLAGKNVCVMLSDSAKNLFGNENVVGQTFTLDINGRDNEITIVGVREMPSSALYKKLYVYDDVEIEMPMTTYEKITGEEQNGFYSVMYVSEEADKQKETMQEIATFFKKKTGATIVVESFTDYAEQLSSIFDYITIFVAFVAAISLLVGGVGVMNIMLVSVTERTQEIGIRKALGARTKSIVLQFLAEAAAITLIGGVLGLIFGYLGGEFLCFLASIFLDMKIVAQIGPFTVLTVALFSIAIGLFFGIYPAKKAAGLNPIEALRQE